MSTSTTAPARRRGSATRSTRLAELNELARTTPGVLTVLATALVLFSVLIGVVTALTVQSKAQSLDDLTTRSGPLSVAAQDIYRALSDADASATSAFLSGGLEPAELRERYESDIAQAEAALAVAVAARASCPSTQDSWRPRGRTTARGCRSARPTSARRPT